MSAIFCSANGQKIFVALERSTGEQVIGVADRDSLSLWKPAYNPDAGSAANVAPVGGNPDLMIFHGNFGTDITTILYTISTEGTSDISPTTLAAKVMNTLVSNPSDANEAWATVDTDQDLLRTIDAGATWTALDAALGSDPTALAVLWSGANDLDRGFVAGDNGVNIDVLYSPNEFSSNEDQASGGLASVTDVCAVEAIEQT